MYDNCVNDMVKKIIVNDMINHERLGSYMPMTVGCDFASNTYTATIASTNEEIKRLIEKNNAKHIRDYIFENAEDVEDLIESGKAKKERQRLEWRKAHNKIQRDLVKHVKFSGDTCIIYWGDGQITKSRWDHSEDFDPEKAILAAMARKLFGDTNIYCEVLQKYAGDGWDHYENYIYPNFVYGEDLNDYWSDECF